MFFDLESLDRARYRGILVVPDVHGYPDVLEGAASRATEESLFLLQLGDLVDRGPASAKVVALMRDIEAAGAGTFLSGNHEYKMRKYADSGAYGSPGRVRVHQELQEHGRGLLDWFLSRVAEERLFARAPKVLLAHAAYHPEMARVAPSLSEELRERALFGMRDKAKRKRTRVRSREWVGEIPAGVTVVVGMTSLDRRSGPRIERTRRFGNLPRHWRMAPERSLVDAGSRFGRSLVWRGETLPGDSERFSRGGTSQARRAGRVCRCPAEAVGNGQVERCQDRDLDTSSPWGVSR